MDRPVASGIEHIVQLVRDGNLPAARSQLDAVVQAFNGTERRSKLEALRDHLNVDADILLGDYIRDARARGVDKRDPQGRQLLDELDQQLALWHGRQ